MDAFARSVDATFRSHGVDGQLDPDGAQLSVKLLPNRPDEILQVGRLDIQSETTIYEIRSADLAGYGRGAIVEVAGQRFRIQAPPVASDPRRLKFKLNLVKV